MSKLNFTGVGMTSQRTRDRLVQRLCDQGISNYEVLDVMRTTPRHLFLDEALAHRAYEDDALPIGFQQTLSQPYTVARIKLLQEKARERFRVLGARNVHLKHADGGFGWPEKGPFDGIISTAAPEQIPEELVEQLAVGGRLVIPIGDNQSQKLTLVERTADKIITTVVEPAFFVPLKSGIIR